MCYTTPKNLPLYKETKVMVEQMKDEEDKYWFRVWLNDELVFKRKNTKAKEFKNVHLYKTDPWYRAAKACVTDVFFRNVVDANEKGNTKTIFGFTYLHFSYL